MPGNDFEVRRAAAKERLGERKAKVESEISALKARLRRGDPSAEGKLEAQHELCQRLRGELTDQRTRRSAISDVLCNKPDTNADNDTPHPVWG